MERAVMLADRPAVRMPSSSSSSSGNAGFSIPQYSSSSYTSNNTNGVTIDASGSIGNFKGVMLCNRPDPMDGVGGRGNSNGEPQAFRVPSVHETFHPNGQNTELAVLRNNRRRIRGPNPTIMKVKAYLQELSDKKADLLRQKQEEEARVAEKHARIAESQRLLRELIRNNTGDDETTVLQENNRTANTSNAYQHLPPAHPVRKDKTVDFSMTSKKSAKPAWAKSEAAVVAAEEDETDDLLDFANNLDYDNYVDGLEDKAGETLVNRRLREVETVEAQERAKLQALEAEEQADQEKEEAKLRRERRRRRARRRARAARRKAKNPVDGEGVRNGNEEEKKENDDDDPNKQDEEWDGDSSIDDDDDGGSNTDSNHSTTGEGYDSTDTGTNHRRKYRYNSDNDDDDVGSDNDSLGPLRYRGRGGEGGGNDAASIATSVLSSASSIRNIHSKKSLTAVITRTQAEEQQHIRNHSTPNPYEGQIGATTLPINNPKIIVHNDYKEALDNKKNLVSNLPYQHRNPAI